MVKCLWLANLGSEVSRRLGAGAGDFDGRAANRERACQEYWRRIGNSKQIFSRPHSGFQRSRQILRTRERSFRDQLLTITEE
jgi:hypothetical protein